MPPLKWRDNPPLRPVAAVVFGWSGGRLKMKIDEYQANSGNVVKSL